MENNLHASKTVVKSATFNLLGYIVSAAYLFFLIPIAVDYLGVTGYGLWALIIAISTYVGLADLGIGMAFMKFVAEYFSTKDYVRVNKVVQHGILFYVVVGLAVLAVGFLAFPLIFELLRIDGNQFDLAQTAFMLALLSLVLSNIGGVFASVLGGLQRMDVYNVLAICVLVTRFIGTIAVLVLGYGLTAIFLVEIVVTLAAMIPLVFAAKKLFPQLALRFAGFDAALMKELVRFGTKMQISKLAEMVHLQFDKLILSRYIGLASVSVYDFGSRPLNRLRALPLSMLNALVPAISALSVAENSERIQAAYIRTTRYLILVALPFFGFVGFFAHEILFAWLGQEYPLAVIAMQVLSVAYFVNVLTGVLSLVAQGRGEPQYLMWAMLIQAGLNIVLSTILLLTFGFVGAVVGTATSMVIGGAIFLQTYGVRVVRHPFQTIVQQLWKPLISVVASIGVAYMVLNFVSLIGLGSTRWEVAAATVVAAVAFLGVYGILIRLVGVFSEDDRGFLLGVIPERFKYLLRV